MALNPPPGTALAVAIVGLVLIYWLNKPRAVRMSWPVLGMLASVICLAAFFVAYLVVAQAKPELTDAEQSAARLTTLKTEHTATVSELAATRQELATQKQELAKILAAQPSVESESRANRILLREKQLAQIGTELDAKLSRVRASAEGAMQGEIRRWNNKTGRVVLGADRPINDYYMAVNELKQAAKGFFDNPPELTEPKFSEMARVTPREKEVNDPEDQQKIRALSISIEHTNAWLDALKAQWQREVDINNAEIKKGVASPSPTPPASARLPAAPVQPPVAPLTPKEEAALSDLSAIINSKGRAASKLSEALLQGTNPVTGGAPEYQNPLFLRDRAQEIANAVDALDIEVYRDFLPARTFYSKELLGALGTSSTNRVDGAMYPFSQSALSYVSSLHTAMLIADEAKNEHVARMALGTTSDSRNHFETAANNFKKWIDSFNERVAARRLVK